MQDYEDSIVFLGELGRFQQIVFFWLCAHVPLHSLATFAVIFLADVPSHHCLVPEVNLTQVWLNATIPIEVVNEREELSRCSRYRLDVVRNLSAQGLIPGRDVNLTDLEQEGCVDGWSYSKDIYQSTIVSEFDLVCADQWKRPFTSTAYFLGVLFGSFFSGHISDRFGRKPVLCASIAVTTFFNFLQVFSPSWMVFTIAFFSNGFGHISKYLSTFVLGSELLTGKVRVIFSTMGITIAFTIGYMLLPLIAYFLRDWRSLLLSISLPNLLFLPMWWIIPESPRWLLSQGRVAEAEAIVREAAKINNVDAPQVIFEDYRAHADETKTHPKENHNVFHLLRKRNIRNVTVILCLLWLSLATAYYAMSMNTSQLHANPYIGCFIAAATEIPAYLTSWLAMRHLPRRLTVITVMLLVAVLLYFIQLVPKSLAVALEMLGRFGITVGESLKYTYTAEIYPTVVRNTATGTCSTVARVGTSFVPFLLSLSFYSRHLPYIILGTLVAVSGFAVFFLPETFGQDLPQTIQQMHKTRSNSIKCPFNMKTKQEEQNENVVFSTE